MGAEWKTFNNDETNNVDPCRVGGAENHLMSGSDLSTMIGTGTSISVPLSMRVWGSKIFQPKISQFNKF